MTQETAWVTLATNDSYAVGAMVLAQSLRNVGTRHRLHVLYSPGVSIEMRTQLRNVFDGATEVDVLSSGDDANLALIGRPDLGVTFTKLHCWLLTQYSKCVFMDADTFVVQSSDELFERPEFSAAPDVGWPDYFNTGVFVFVPSEETYKKLLEFATTRGSFDGGDQGLLNQYFSGWRESSAEYRLPFIYNVTTVAVYGYAAAIKRNADQVKIVHFIGKQKPWTIFYGTDGGGFIYVRGYTKMWQDVYHQIEDSCQIQYHQIPAEVLPQAQVLGSSVICGAGYEAWEAGNIDYKGSDSFDLIQKAIEKTLSE